MSQSVSFFNFSLKKVLSTEPDVFNKARIKILYIVLLLSFAKIFISIAIALQHEQAFQLWRALAMLLVYLVLFKLLLGRKEYLRAIAHIMIWSGLLLIWSNVLIYVQGINIITLQFIFMIILSSFYLLDSRYGMAYSFLGIFPILLLIVDRNAIILTGGPAGALASPGFEIIVALNFITLVAAHYLFHQAFALNLAEKEGLNDRLQVAVTDANIAAKSKTDFLSTMSHELRTPLNSVIGMTELLLDDPHDAEQEENLKILSFAAANLHNLINDILDFNKLDSDKLALESISVDLHDLLNNICMGLRFQAKEKGLSLILDIDEDIKERLVTTDPTRISQIIYNLAGNAIKFTQHGSVSVSVRAVSIDEDAILVRFAVIDTGIGISEDKHVSIFDPFVQASSNTTRNFGGTGLGLAIVKKLLKLFDTDIHLLSSAGKGSNFYFDISFNIDQQPDAAKTTGAVPVYDLSDLKILIAEDNSMNRLLLKKVFAKWNNEPVFAENGQEAIDKVCLEPFDVVLMDIHMPLLDGYDAARAIRKIIDPAISGVPIIALTASVSNQLSEKIMEAGMNDYIYKPFNTKNLYGKLKSISPRTQRLKMSDQK